MRCGDPHNRHRRYCYWMMTTNYHRLPLCIRWEMLSYMQPMVSGQARRQELRKEEQLWLASESPLLYFYTCVLSSILGRKDSTGSIVAR